MEQGRELHSVGGVDHVTDQVERRNAFIRRHPHIAVSSPRENGTRAYRAAWTDVASGGVVLTAAHEELRRLLDWLDDAFGADG